MISCSRVGADSSISDWGLDWGFGVGDGQKHGAVAVRERVVVEQIWGWSWSWKWMIDVGVVATRGRFRYCGKEEEGRTWMVRR